LSENKKDAGFESICKMSDYFLLNEFKFPETFYKKM
jgi:hypothetical protein